MLLFVSIFVSEEVESAPHPSPTSDQVIWQVYDIDVIITKQDYWTYHFYIDARDIPESLKTGTENCEAAALHQARDNLREWFRG
jgi:hypothetical protein